MIHPLSDVKTNKIGRNTNIWQYAVVLENAVIGDNCNINCHTFIENDVIIGNNVTVKAGVFLWDGIIINNNVFIGPNVTFINDKYPRSKQYPAKFLKTIVKENASIGAAAIIMGGVIIGEFSLIGAGSLVTKSIPDFALAAGSPAKIVGWVDEGGNRLKTIDGKLVSEKGEMFLVENNVLKRL
jgi:UDP-2-acetamido-3-amino-2,3-dideoxy-glucuronate N-acetyltransferase